MKTARELEIPARKNMPDSVAVLTVFLILLPAAMLNGTYTGSMVEVSSTLGIYTEDITLGVYAASAGMAVSYPIVPKILNAFSGKILLLADLFLQLILSWICARQSEAGFLIALSFVIGFLKGFIMLWIIRRIKFIFSPRDIRSEFYGYFYPIVFSGGQLSMVITARLAYHYDWKYMYYFMMILLLAAILAVTVVFRHDRPTRKVSIRELHLKEMAVFSTGLLMVIYAITYGKTLDWMASPRIRFCLGAGTILIAVFLREQFRSAKPYVSLKPLFQWKAIVGYLYMMLVMFLSTSTTLTTTYITKVLGLDYTRSYTLYIWLIPGYIAGGAVCYWWFRVQKWRFRILIAAGMGCFAVFFGSMYFTMSAESTYGMLFLPVFFRGLGMMILIISFALYAVEDMPPGYLLSNAFFMITLRSVLTPVAASAFYGNLLYRMQNVFYVRLAEHNDIPLSSWQLMQQQGTLLALRYIVGWMFAAVIVLTVVSRFIPFHKTVKMPVIRTGEDMV